MLILGERHEGGIGVFVSNLDTGDDPLDAAGARGARPDDRHEDRDGGVGPAGPGTNAA